MSGLFYYDESVFSEKELFLDLTISFEIFWQEFKLNSFFISPQRVKMSA